MRLGGLHALRTRPDKGKLDAFGPRAYRWHDKHGHVSCPGRLGVQNSTTYVHTSCSQEALCVLHTFFALLPVGCHALSCAHPHAVVLLLSSCKLCACHQQCPHSGCRLDDPIHGLLDVALGMPQPLNSLLTGESHAGHAVYEPQGGIEALQPPKLADLASCIVPRALCRLAVPVC